MGFLGLVLAGVVCLGLLAFSIFLFGFIALYSAMIFGAPYVPSSDEKRRVARKFIQGRHRVLEFGSGDGRVSIDLSEKNDRVDGYEINPYLVWISRWNARKRGVSEKVHFYWKNFWKVNVGEYDTVYLYGISYIMGQLEKKFLQELAPGSMVVSVGFRFPNWVPEKSEGSVSLYIKK